MATLAPVRPISLAAVVAAPLAALAAAPAPGAVSRPTVKLQAPRVNSDTSRSRTAQLTWGGEGSGLRYRLEYRRNTEIGTRWRTLTPDTSGLDARFRGRPGVTYLFRLRARDADGALSRYTYRRTVFPFDERGPRVRFSPQWERVRRPGAYGHTLTIANRVGATASISFDGSRVLLIARRVRTGGRLLVTVDGRSVKVGERGRPHQRLALFRSQLLEPGRHRLHLRSLGGGRVNVDAVAVAQGSRAPRR